LRGVIGVVAATAAALLAVSVPSADHASALWAGYGQFGGYDRGGYEYSS
jgi:hypothetical protein